MDGIKAIPPPKLIQESNLQIIKAQLQTWIKGNNSNLAINRIDKREILRVFVLKNKTGTFDWPNLSFNEQASKLIYMTLSQQASKVAP